MNNGWIKVSDMIEGWEELKKRLELYQKWPNSLWYTDEPVFCDFTKKQINIGYIIATNEKIVGVCDRNYFYNKLSHKLFTDNEYVYMCCVESSALPVKKTIKKERSKLTLALRYKVLKRDNFKCVACGKNASEVEMHVDHVIPVSKGGKTIESNLQTLCSKCNLGKSNVY